MTTGSNQPLYKICDELAHVLEQIDDADGGEIPPEFEQQLDALSLAFDSKIDGICRFDTFLRGNADAIKFEIDRLSARHARLESRRQRLRDYVKRCLEQTGRTKLETTLYSVRIQKNGRPSIRLEGSTIPPELLRIREEFDGAKAYELYKAGAKLPDCVQVIHGTHLRIG